jgi:hypothetical protein
MFYEYCQNNSGGGFAFDKVSGITHIVIVEADSPDQADVRAEEIGLYFDGCANGQDCSCCGDRWYRAYGKGTEEPEVYGKPVAKAELLTLWMKPNPDVVVHYKDGRIEWHTPREVDRLTKVV